MLEDNPELKKALEEIGSRVQNDLPISKDLSNEDLSLLYSIGHSFYQVGSYDEAKTIFEKLVIQKPLERKNWVALAGTLQMQKDFPGALRAWSMAALLDDSDAQAHFHAAECLFSLRDKEGGLKALGAAETRIDETSDLFEKIGALKETWDQWS